MDYINEGLFIAVPESIRIVERPVNTIVDDKEKPS